MTSAYENYTSASFANHYGSNDNGNDQVNGYLNYYHNFPTSSMNPQACPYNYYSEHSANLFSTTTSSKPEPQLPCDDVSTTTASTQSSHYDVDYLNQNYTNNKAKVSTYWNQFNTKMAINYQMQQQQQYQEYPAVYAKDSNYNILSGNNKPQANISVVDHFNTERNQILNDRKLFAQQLTRECDRNWGTYNNAEVSEEYSVKDYIKCKPMKTKNNENYEHKDSPALRALLTNPEKRFRHDVNYFYKQYRKNNTSNIKSSNYFDSMKTVINPHLGNITTPPLSPDAYLRGPDHINSADSPLSHDWTEGSGKFFTLQ